MRLHSSLPRPSEIRLPAKVRQIDTGCGTALSHPVEAVNDRLQTETQPEGPPPDNRAQVNGLGFQSPGSIASDRDVRGARAMSAMPPIPTKLMRHSKTTRCAICDISRRGRRHSYSITSGAREQRRRHVQPERLGRSEIDLKLVLDRRLDR